MKFYTDRIINRLRQLEDEVANAGAVSYYYYDRLRAFKTYCNEIPTIASCLAQLPKVPYNYKDHIEDVLDNLPAGDRGYGYRWDAIRQAVEALADKRFLIETQFAPRDFTQYFVAPICNYLVDRLAAPSTMLQLLTRYKRWVEWFEFNRLHQDYTEAPTEGGESVLDRDLRRFLFESGIDNPFSQPRSPGGQADVVAALETDDPLVLEIKVWDSAKNYRENRVRDGLRQVMNYAAMYGKDKGYVVVFNCDLAPLAFISDTNPGEWPARIEADRTYYFLDINIALQPLPISQQDKGKPVKRNEIVLRHLWDSLKDS